MAKGAFRLVLARLGGHPAAQYRATRIAKVSMRREVARVLLDLFRGIMKHI